MVSVPPQMVQNLAQTLASEIADGRRPPGSALPSTRALAAQLGCAPGTVARAYGELRRAGLIAARDRARARVADDGSPRARWWLAGGPRLRLAGSDDPALDALVRAAGEAVEVVPGPRGSVHGLEAMARGQADAAVLHLLHAESGRYNDPYVRRLLPGEPVVLVHLWRREVGLVVPRGNPLGVAGSRDLAGRRVAWRARGSGSRLLLERLLAEAGVEAAPESGEPAIPISRWPPRWRRAPPTPGWRCARWRGRRPGLRRRHGRAVRAGGARGAPSTARPGCSRGCTTRPFAGQVAALGGYDLSRDGRTRRAT